MKIEYYLYKLPRKDRGQTMIRRDFSGFKKRVENVFTIFVYFADKIAKETVMIVGEVVILMHKINQ